MNIDLKRENENKKSCSTSSIYLSSSIYSPNVDLLIKSVATIIHSQLIEDMHLGKTVSSKSDLFYFSEEKYVNEYPGFFDEERIKFLNKTPTLQELSEFIEVDI
jgi:hypothetical protein